VSYISDAYGGSTSDRQIVELSSLKRDCDTAIPSWPKNDLTFRTSSLHDVTVNIPTFFKSKNQMPHDTVMRDRQIASKRVHFERLIGLAKSDKILVQPMNTWETQMSSDIIFVCAMLCNFRAGIVPRDA